MHTETPYLVGLSHFEGIGPIRYRVLKNYFNTAEGIYKASKSELENTGVGKKLIASFDAFRNTINLKKLIEKYESQNIQILTENDNNFPESLKSHSDAPFLLYAIGDLSILSEEMTIAIVGTRKPTRYGVEVTSLFSRELVSSRFTIVSGMAMGIDAVAHRSTLDNSGKTIAVLGCGVDICYPAVNKSLYEDIKKEGLVVSEFPPGKRTSKGVFPSRNRIVAGLSLGVVVTEGSDTSGSLITARYASEYGKDVFAVPGPITSEMSQASTVLLKNGAIPASSANDIISEYKNIHRESTQRKMIDDLEDLTETEQAIVSIVRKNGSVHIDEIVRTATGLPENVLPAISDLEIKGILVETSDGEYSIMY